MDNAEIIASLHVLGLEAGASTEDIHSAFRRLARELHPDVTGQKSSFRFQQVTGAYTVLKNITPEELESVTKNIPEYEKVRLKKSAYSAKIDSILTKYESELKEYIYSSGRETGDDAEMKAVILRMRSTRPKVINAALKRSAPFANRVEFRKALTEILKRPEIDSTTAEIAGSLPFDDTTRKLIALDVSANAGNFPAGLIISLIGTDTNAMESMLLHASPENTAVILRRWPAGKVMNDSVVRTLLSSDDIRILVPILGAIRTHFPRSAANHRKRLQELESHSAAAVRAWARKLL